MATNNINRGVQAKEADIINTRLDMDTSEMSRQPTDNSSTHALSDQTASYVQVIVQKHRRARLPAASSPVASPPVVPTGDEAAMMPATVLLACPALAALQSAYGGVVGGVVPRADHTRAGAGDSQKDFEKLPNKSTFKRECSSSDDGKISTCTLTSPKSTADFCDSIYNCGLSVFLITTGAAAATLSKVDVVEILPLERVSEALVARGARGGSVGRTGRRVRRRGARLLAVLLTPPRLLLDLPVALLLHLERCVLEVVRGVIVEGAVVAAEALGKPALAAAHNAMTAVLAAAAGAARAFREVLRPLAGAALDAVEPLARVAAAVQLVHVHCRCCTPPAPTPPVAV